MKIRPFNDADCFFLKPGRNAWIDQQRERSLQRFIDACQQRLRKLKRDPDMYKELILNEEAVLESARHELDRLKKRSFII